MTDEKLEQSELAGLCPALQTLIGHVEGYVGVQASPDVSSGLRAAVLEDAGDVQAVLDAARSKEIATRAQAVEAESALLSCRSRFAKIMIVAFAEYSPHQSRLAYVVGEAEGGLMDCGVKSIGQEIQDTLDKLHKKENG